MAVHTVQQGECLSSIAASYGLASWRDLFDHPDNAKLKELARHPSILAPGDEVSVPDMPIRWVSCATEIRHRFATKAPTAKLRVFVRDREEKPYEGKRFVVKVGEAETNGQTAAGGLVEVDVPMTAREARLQVWVGDDPDDPEPDIDRELAIAHLDPVESVSGVQGRLLNLGYKPTTSGTLDAPTIAALKTFRAKKGLPEVEKPKAEAGVDDDAAADDGPSYEERLVDDALRSALRTAHEGD
jgi:N-acetylmuramoyl-L-alanine amidase